ncbi:MAG: diguanylate cyclase [Steroidobacteraceae bacterium]
MPRVTAQRTVAQLTEQADTLRRELVGLQQTLRQVHDELDAPRAAQLRDANESLVLAALHAETIAETAVTNLDALSRSSQRDPLTDTPNRALMLDRIAGALTMAQRHGTRVALIFLDIDKFKSINDELGHDVGDEVLKLVTRRLKALVRHSDTVSRHGGDEFLLLLAEVSKVTDAAVVAIKILASLAAPAQIGAHRLHLSASLGISVYPDDGQDLALLVSYADAAMYRSKRRGPGGFEVHNAAFASIASLRATDRAERAQTKVDRSAAGASSPQDLREANERLLIAALDAQTTESHAGEEHHKQIMFLAMVAHELRGPLAPLSVAADMLKHAITNESLLGKVRETIKRQVAQIARLVEDLLDGARASTGRFRLERVLVDMTVILGHAVETCLPALNTRHQTFSLVLPDRKLNVHGDPVRLCQIFSNLLDNASKYTPDHGKIELRAELTSQHLIITIADSGIGISAESLSRVFEMFVQEAHALRVHNGGLGIGLAVVRELVQAQGGTVTGHSAGRDQGSEFVVTLPLDQN